MMSTLSFGTAGIRAPLGEGPHSLNEQTVAMVARALAETLLLNFKDAQTQGVCIGFDGRTQSDVFARIVAEVMLERGLVVRIFDRVCPTPLLAFVTRHFDSVAGVMITASHNPPTDNGIKVYWRGGAQVVAPHDAQITKHLRALDFDLPIAGKALATARSEGNLSTFSEADVDLYLDAIEKLYASDYRGSPLRIGYTALCGVGSAITRRLLARKPVHELCEVIEQQAPLADFGGLSSPNPEHRPALTKLMALAEAERLDIAFAHDPDADRLAVLARDETSALRALSGDEVGVLLGDHMLRKAADPARVAVLSTVVSSAWLAHIASAHGAHFAQTLTGFKWIAAHGRALERERGLTFLYGYEEAIGYAFGALGDDKDGIAALGLMIELATELSARGSSLIGRLDELAKQHGLFATRQLTYVGQGEAGKARMERAIERLRHADPGHLLQESNATLEDFNTRTPSANLLVFQGMEGARVCVRPSGTEPKLKVYLHARVRVAEGDVAAARDEADQRLDALARAVDETLAF